GAEPLARLHERLVDVCGQERTLAVLGDAAALAAAPGRAGTLLRRHVRERGLDFLMVVDQLEELATHGSPAAEPRAFLQALVSIADDDGAGIRLVVAMRDDFLVRLSRNPELREAILRSMVLLGPPEPDELTEALRAPATRAGFDFEPGVVDAMVAAVAEDQVP